MVASFVLIGGHENPAFAGASQPMEERHIPYWPDFGMREVLRQILPTPQLLFIHPYRHPESDQRNGYLIAPDEFKILYPSRFTDYYEKYQPSAGGLNTEALILPSELQNEPPYIEHEPPHHSGYARLQLFPDEWKLPSTSLRPPNEKDSPFFRVNNMRAPPTMRPSIFSAAEFEEDNLFQLSIPKRLSVYGDDLRLFEHSVNCVLNDPNLLLWDQGAASWMMIFFRWSPLDQDEMFSTLLLPSP